MYYKYISKRKKKGQKMKKEGKQFLNVDINKGELRHQNKGKNEGNKKDLNVYYK